RLFRTGKRLSSITGGALPTAGHGSLSNNGVGVEVANSELAAQLSALNGCVHRIDGLASYYGLKFRSSTTAEFMLMIVGAFCASLAMLAFPEITGGSVAAQMAINGVVLVDMAIRAKQRWHERWLDYRLIAERLRCLRFLRPLGMGLGRKHII